MNLTYPPPFPFFLCAVVVIVSTLTTLGFTALLIKGGMPEGLAVSLSPVMAFALSYFGCESVLNREDYS